MDWCKAHKPDGTEGTATLEMKYDEGKKEITMRSHGCIVKNDANLKNFIQNKHKPGADLTKFEKAKYYFYTCDSEFAEKTSIIETTIHCHRFSKPSEDKTTKLEYSLHHVVKVQEHIFLPCNCGDYFNESQFLKEYSKELWVPESLDDDVFNNKEINGLIVKEGKPKFIPVTLKDCQSSNMFEVDKGHYEQLEDTDPVLLQNKKTIVGSYIKLTDENRITFSVFGHVQEEDGQRKKSEKPEGCKDEQKDPQVQDSLQEPTPGPSGIGVEDLTVRSDKGEPMAAVIEYSPEELNYFLVCYVTTRILPDGLRTVFKQEWDNRYQATPYGTWQDTAKNGMDFYNMESPRNRKTKHRLLAVIINGNTSEWDCTCLFYAILFSNSVGNSLDPDVRKSVDDLRRFRNDLFAHVSDGKLNESHLNFNMEKVITAFASLKLSTADIEGIRTWRRFPTKELRDIKEPLQEEKMRNQELQLFCVLPSKPNHQVIDRPDKIREIQTQMKRLRSTKPNEVTVIYLSGNPGCGKSEIARQVGEKVFEDASDHATEIKFVFTLNASSHDKLILSYVEFAISLKCDKNSVIANVVSKDLSQEDKLNLLKCFVAPKLRKYSASWLIIVDNVTDVNSVLRYLPQAGEKTEGKGQMLVTTQDSRSIAPDDSYAYHLSLSKGMNRSEALRTLSEISDIVGKEETTLEIAKALDFQPLALACAATYMKRVCITTPTFSWEEYGEKLKQGKREATEGEYKRISVAYSQTMTAAVRLAVEKEMAEGGVMMHALHFLSKMASKLTPLEYVVQYVTGLIPDEDEELVATHIASSSLILSSENQPKEIGVHQVVHECLQNPLFHQNKI